MEFRTIELPFGMLGVHRGEPPPLIHLAAARGLTRESPIRDAPGRCCSKRG